MNHDYRNAVLRGDYGFRDCADHLAPDNDDASAALAPDDGLSAPPAEAIQREPDALKQRSDSAEICVPDFIRREMDLFESERRLIRGVRWGIGLTVAAIVLALAAWGIASLLPAAGREDPFAQIPVNP